MRMFLRLSYNDITKYDNTQSWTGTEKIMGEKCDLPVAPYTVPVSHVLSTQCIDPSLSWQPSNTIQRCVRYEKHLET